MNFMCIYGDVYFTISRPKKKFILAILFYDKLLPVVSVYCWTHRLIMVLIIDRIFGRVYSIERHYAVSVHVYNLLPEIDRSSSP